MQRNIVIPIVGGVVAALVLVGAILLIGKNNNKKTDLTISTPIPSATVTDVPTTSPTATPTGSPAASASPAASSTAATSAPTPAPTSAPSATPYRAASSVNCEKPDDAKYCSREDAMVVADGKATNTPDNKGAITYPGGLTITMVSKFDEAKHNLHVDVTIENKTKKTFVFPKREIALLIERNGSRFDLLKTTGASFEMTPGGKMTGKFDRPISKDGSYTWQTKTWYFEK
jgi:hypothetical protein